MTKPLMRQCKLIKDTMYMTTWLPIQFAKVGKILKLKESNGEWSDGWVVDEVGAVQEYEDCIEHAEDYKHQRKASDI